MGSFALAFASKGFSELRSRFEGGAALVSGLHGGTGVWEITVCFCELDCLGIARMLKEFTWLKDLEGICALPEPSRRVCRESAQCRVHTLTTQA